MIQLFSLIYILTLQSEHRTMNESILFGTSRSAVIVVNNFKNKWLFIKLWLTLGLVKRFTELKSRYMLSNKKYCKQYE